MTKREIDDLIFDLEKNHLALKRPVTIYSRAVDEIRRSHLFIDKVCWRAADWSEPDIIANVADFYDTTPKALREAMDKLR